MVTAAKQILERAAVIPVLMIDDEAQAVPLARALVAGGIDVLEVTLRTAAGLPSITRIRNEVPEAFIGVGTVTNGAEFDAACEAGSQFVVTPGITGSILAAADDTPSIPLIPGVATVSELMRCLDHGIDCLKFFPAEANGGAPALKAFHGPFPQVSFCPTGGVSLANLPSYYALPNVLTVGGSWLTPAPLLAAGDWAAITALAEEASSTVNSLESSS